MEVPELVGIFTCYYVLIIIENNEHKVLILCMIL